MQFYSITDRGKQRENNEDCCIARQVGEYTVLILADGMGGHKGGETASSKAVETVFSYLHKKLKKNLIAGQIMMMLSDALEKANNEIYTLSQKDENLGGMGTTAEVCIISKDTAYIAHIGDSRVYKVMPHGEIKRLTKDHSLVEYMVETGSITREEAELHPQKNVIMRALGVSPEINADIFHEKLDKGDRLLLCSDGLSNMIDEETIASVLKCALSPQEGAQKLVALANEAGGADNITVIISMPDMEESE